MWPERPYHLMCVSDERISPANSIKIGRAGSILDLTKRIVLILIENLPAIFEPVPTTRNRRPRSQYPKKTQHAAEAVEKKRSEYIEAHEVNALLPPAPNPRARLLLMIEWCGACASPRRWLLRTATSCSMLICPPSASARARTERFA